MNTAFVLVFLLPALAPKLVFIECLAVGSSRAGRFVLVHCNCLLLGCCRGLISSVTVVLMKERAGGGHGWWPLQAEFSYIPIAAILGHNLRGPSPALNSVSFGVLIATTFPGDLQPLRCLKNHSLRPLKNFLRILISLPSFPSAAQHLLVFR